MPWVWFAMVGLLLMKPSLKLGLYVITVVGAVVFGSLFLQGWRQAGGGDSRPRAAAPSGKAESGLSPEALKVPPPATTEITTATGSVATGTALSTNPSSAGFSPVPAAGGSSVGGPGPESPLEQEAIPAHRPGAVTRGLGKMITWGLLAVFSLAGLAGLVAYDVSHFTANRATEALFNDRGEDFSASAYEQIEKVYGEGDYLETVRLLREFLTANPREVHAQIRIAEIYEKDLHNLLAAALEYEEVLKLPLEPVRRGWTGIHLVNLYNRLDKPGQAVALMQQICVECPETPAAAKARERLVAMGESVPDSPHPGSAGGEGLPPGFRRKR